MLGLCGGERTLAMLPSPSAQPTAHRRGVQSSTAAARLLACAQRPACPRLIGPGAPTIPYRCIAAREWAGVAHLMYGPSTCGVSGASICHSCMVRVRYASSSAARLSRPRACRWARNSSTATKPCGGPAWRAPHRTHVTRVGTHCQGRVCCPALPHERGVAGRGGTRVTTRRGRRGAGMSQLRSVHEPRLQRASLAGCGEARARAHVM